MLKVVLFSGGRGSRVLSKELVRNPRVQLTVAINGYDDGASTGEVRRFLGDCLGPSDFRKNATRLARELQSCSASFIDLMELRLPAGCSRQEAFSVLHLDSQFPFKNGEFQAKFLAMCESLSGPEKAFILERFLAFKAELQKRNDEFCFSDCSLGNLVFAGSFLRSGRNFNDAISDICSVLNLPSGLIENVTVGTNAYLVALNRENQVLASEADLVDARRKNFIKDLFLSSAPISAQDSNFLSRLQPEETLSWLAQHSAKLEANPRLLNCLSSADLIVYSPGTQHSSLFPSYLTPGIGVAIAGNLKAIKLLITNVHEDSEIPETSAVELVERAVYYLKEKNKLRIPKPCLITHYLLNDPAGDQTSPYIPLGKLDMLEDPRLIRIANYEGVSGHHDAAKVLVPYVESILAKEEPSTVAIILQNTKSLNKITQTILEMIRGGMDRASINLSVFYDSSESLEASLVENLPFPTYNLSGSNPFSIIDAKSFDYLILFDSSGMYKGEDIAGLAVVIQQRRFDAVWGSRRLSLKEIRESYKLRYRHNLMLKTVSYVGSHLLSLAYLVFFGKYISDTLSEVRAIRTSYLTGGNINLDSKTINHEILCRLLKNKSEIFETPVQFFPLSPEKVRRTTILDGIRALFTILKWRFKGARS